MYLVTGGAGFIGSNVVHALSARGDRVVVCDWFGSGQKWKNLSNSRIYDFVFPTELTSFLSGLKRKLQGVIHLGAISTTTETDVDAIVRQNIQTSIQLWEWCSQERVTFVYASSAATYGDGKRGFQDRSDEAYLTGLEPLNAYGWSKHIFDQRVVSDCANGQLAPPHWAGLKFFNVYGPRECHKGDMRSVIRKNFDSLRSGEALRLFKSARPDYRDGEQLRDFVYVDDCVRAVLWFLDGNGASDIYNIGAGQPRTWIDLGRAMFRALGLAERFEFIDLPEGLADKYQYYTCADMSKLIGVGYDFNATSLEEGVEKYILYLSNATNRDI